MVVPSNSRRQTVRHHSTCGFGGTHPLSLSLSCFRLVVSLSSPNSKGRQFAIIQPAALAARLHCHYPSHAPSHASAPVPKQTSLSYQNRRQKQTAQSPALAKVVCPVTSVSGVSSSPRFPALIAATTIWKFSNVLIPLRVFAFNQARVVTWSALVC